MTLVGVALIIIGVLLTIPIITTIGVVLAVVGAALWILGSLGRAIGGRPHYW